MVLLTSMSASCSLSSVLSQRLLPVHSGHPDLYQFYLISRCYSALMLYSTYNPRWTDALQS